MNSLTIATEHSTDEADIRQRIDKLAGAIRARDLEAVMSIYTTDVVSFDIEPPPQHVGAEAEPKKSEPYQQQAAPPTDTDYGIVINNAANSSVGRLFTVWAEQRQIDTISVVRSARRAQQLAERYPAVPVVSTDKDEWATQVRAIAGRRPISVAVDPVGGQAAADLISLLAPGGTLITYGMLAEENIPLHASALLGNEIGLRGLNIGRWLTGVAPERRASDIAAAAALAATQPSELDVAGTYSLGQITDAVHHVSRAGKIGTVIVHT